MTRIRRTFIATLVASAVTVASFGAASSSAVQATASSCTYSVWKIYKREHVTCRKSKKVLNGAYGDGQKQDGWSCNNTGGLIPEGRCHKGQSKSFKFKQK
jgi:hypothetical protein